MEVSQQAMKIFRNQWSEINVLGARGGIELEGVLRGNEWRSGTGDQCLPDSFEPG